MGVFFWFSSSMKGPKLGKKRSWGKHCWNGFAQLWVENRGNLQCLARDQAEKSFPPREGIREKIKTGGPPKTYL